MRISHMSPHKKLHPQQAGFSLVEILVGLVIGLLATLVIMQVFSVFEGQKRTTTGNADAQTNGGIALYSIMRDLQMAGYGLLPTTDSALECDAPTIAAAASAVIPAASPLSPVIITDGGTGSDTVAIRYSTSPTAGNPVAITGVAGSDVTINNSLGCQAGVALVVTGPTTCYITKVTSLVNVIDASGSAVAATATLSDATGAVVSANLACLGEWKEVKYAVNAGNLERDASPMLAGIVNVQAQYGIAATPDSNTVTEWKDATGIWAATSTTPTTVNRNRIKALRIAVVTRDSTLEKDVVTKLQANNKLCSAFDSDTPLGLCAWAGSVGSPAPEIDLTGSNINWQRYRYRVFETIIPLRNVIWSKGTL